MYAHDDVDDDPISCPICGGPLLRLGQLGRLIHSRCRTCGIEHSVQAPDPEPGELEPDPDDFVAPCPSAECTCDDCQAYTTGAELEYAREETARNDEGE